MRGQRPAVTQVDAMHPERDDGWFKQAPHEGPLPSASIRPERMTPEGPPMGGST